jgi:hypothetical protein
MEFASFFHFRTWENKVVYSVSATFYLPNPKSLLVAYVNMVYFLFQPPFLFQILRPSSFQPFQARKASIPARKFSPKKKTAQAMKFRAVGLALVNIPAILACSLPHATWKKDSSSNPRKKKQLAAKSQGESWRRRWLQESAAASSAGVDGCIGVNRPGQ